MSLRFHDSLSRGIEPFAPLEPGRVRLYTCGPTVYDRAHIGNFRAFLWEDLLRRYLRWKGFEVEQVMNLTDVDDRTIAAALERGVPLHEITDPVIDMFLEDWETLGLEPVEHRPRATEHVPGMIRLVEALEEAGLTYESEGSIYFAIGRFPDYGALAGLDPESIESGERVTGDEEYDKENARDFVLWKGGERGPEAEVASWPSPWGPGRPGWHLECSSMAMELLGETIDIHTGGVDNLFPHHTNEIAQSEGATGKTFARTWLHAEHLLVEGRKMSKSLGNCFTVPELVERGHAPSAIRYLLLSGHYRSQLNFTFEGLGTADAAVGRIHDLRRRLREASKVESSGSGGLEETAGEARSAFEAALDDDLNVSEALAATFGFVRRANQGLDDAHPAAPPGLDRALDFLEDFERVFGVLSLRDREAEGADADLVAWAVDRLEARAMARAERDWSRADRIREELEARDVALEDTPEGTRYRIGSHTGRVPVRKAMSEPAE